MKWTEVRIKTTEEANDAVSEMLTSIGAGGVVIEDPNDIRRQLENPGSLDYADDKFLASLGEDVIVKAYFHMGGEKARAELEQQIKEKLSFISGFLDVGEGLTGFSEVDDEDWATAWKKYYKPFSISGRIVVKPTWEEYQPGPGETVIEMDPGMAFGTGTHETTRMCAELLDEYMEKGCKVMDVGCGTGILGIIACKLGAEHVEALDIDEVAVRVTRENCLLNHVQDRVSASAGVLGPAAEEAGAAGAKADIIVANIIADVIIGLSKLVPGYLKSRGLFIASGIIRERRDEVLEAYKSRGFSLLKMLEMGEWVAMALRMEESGS